MKFSAKLLQAAKQLWQEALSKFPGDDVAARAWFDEHIIHRVQSAPENEKAAQEDAFVERVRTICIDAARMYPDPEAAMEWALDRWEREVGSLGNRDDPKVRNVMRKCLALAYSGKWGKERGLTGPGPQPSGHDP